MPHKLHDQTQGIHLDHIALDEAGEPLEGEVESLLLLEVSTFLGPEVCF